MGDIKYVVHAETCVVENVETVLSLPIRKVRVLSFSTEDINTTHQTQTQAQDVLIVKL
jgi:hypothetical protein